MLEVSTRNQSTLTALSLGDGGVVEDVAPIRKRCVGRNNRAALVTVAGGDDLVKEVGSLLVESGVAMARRALAVPSIGRNPGKDFHSSRRTRQPMKINGAVDSDFTFSARRAKLVPVHS
jgi:hypothetical protein